MSVLDYTLVKFLFDNACVVVLASPRADTYAEASGCFSCAGLGLLGLNLSCKRVFNFPFPALLAAFY